MTLSVRCLLASALLFCTTGWTFQVIAQGNCENSAQFPLDPVAVTSLGNVQEVSLCIYFQEFTQFTAIQAGGTYVFTATENGYITVREGAVGGVVLAQGVSPVEVSTTTNADLYVHYNVDETCATATVCQVTTVQLLLDCTQPEVSFATSADCTDSTYFITVTISDLGDATTVDITNTGGADTITAVGVGTYELGPFSSIDGVSVTVVHNDDPLCNINSPLFQNPICPELVVCGQPPLEETYCYVANDLSAWSYAAVGGGSLRLRFLRGTIESNFYDQLRIYEGTDNNGDLLFSHDNTTAHNLGPVGSAVLNTIGNYYDVEVYSTIGSIYMEMGSDGSVECATTPTYDPWEWEVVCLDCTIPVANVTVVDDCPNNQFSIPVNVTSTGDGAVVNISYTVNGGAPTIVPDVGVGETIVGPFTINDVVNVTVEHESNALCNIEFGDITDTDTCPNLIVCGAIALEETYCYEGNDIQDWLYQSVGAGTLRLTFGRGTIESNTFDDLSIYDGTDNTGPVLFSHTNAVTYNLGPVGSAILNTSTNFYGVEVYSTTGSLYMEMSSDASVQCSSMADYDPWEWEVVCLDCTVPQVSATVVDDCDTDEFSVPVEVTDTGDGTTVDIVYILDGDTIIVQGAGVGVTTLGPFPLGSTVNVSVEHETNPLCNISLGNFTDTGLCPNLITCGEPALETTYCYGPFDNTSWGYQIVGSGTLRLTFIRGTIESNFFDNLSIHDGTDNTGPLLFSHNSMDIYNLGPVGSAVLNASTNFYGVEVYSTTGNLFMEMSSDGFVDCSSSATYDPWEWVVVCLDCELPDASATAIQNCTDSTFVLPVNIVSTGSGATVNIVYTVNGGPDQSVDGLGTGESELGPFAFGDVVNVLIEHEDNSLCNVTLGDFTNPPICPQIICGAEELMETHCYTFNDNSAWSYELAGGTGALHLTFIRGTIESSTWDRVRIYDGADNTGTLLFSHTNTLTYNLGPIGSAVLNASGNYYGVDVVSTSGGLYMEMESDGIIDCSSSTDYDPWEWEVYCVGCQAPGISYNMVPNCFDRTFTTEVIVTQAPPAEGLLIENVLTGENIMANATGVYGFGPYDQDAPTAFEIIGLDNPLCSYFSDTTTYASEDCVLRTCGFDNFEYCYMNDEDRWYTFQADASVPITIGFLEGQMLPGDFIVVYNGYDENAAVIYQGNNQGNLSGFAVNSQNANNVLTLRINSNATGSCDDGQATTPLRWYVACGAVGVDDMVEGDFSMFPNPTNGLLYINLGNEDHGKLQLRLLDMSGRAVIEQQIVARAGELNTIDMEGLMSGQYMVQLIAEQWVRTQRVQLVR